MNILKISLNPLSLCVHFTQHEYKSGNFQLQYLTKRLDEELVFDFFLDKRLGCLLVSENKKYTNVKLCRYYLTN